MQHPQETVIKIIIIIMAPYIPGDQIGMKVGYSVEEGCRDPALLDERLPLLQHADLRDKVVLLRVDHNVVKKGTTRFRDRSPRRSDHSTYCGIVVQFCILRIYLRFA